MVDTNILLSAGLFRNDRMERIMRYVAVENTMVLCSFVVEELKDVVLRKFPARIKDVDALLFRFPYEYVYTPDQIEPDAVGIRDQNDYPILYTAMIEDVDILLTGDKDFQDLPIDKPEILTPNQLCERYAI